jgi:hypothetical protein
MGHIRLGTESGQEDWPNRITGREGETEMDLGQENQEKGHLFTLPSSLVSLSHTPIGQNATQHDKPEDNYLNL